MVETTAWQPRRHLILLMVVALHLGLIAALLRPSPPDYRAAAKPLTVELLFIPPVRPPKRRPENYLPYRLSTLSPTSIVTPLFDAESPLPPSSRSRGNGSGVDWEAEAHRALQAFEIRTNDFAGGASNPGMPVEDNWSRTQHHPGDRYKTETGDWIVWINANCYQVASAAASTYARGGAPPQTVCPDQEKPRRAGAVKTP
jgi:hypothetical protein